MKKLLVVWIIILLVGMSVPSTGINVEKSTASNYGNTLYVGGSGPGNYTKIQDAINDSSDGDAVFVYNGTYYEQDIIVDKSIKLVSASRNNTIIHGQGNYKCVVYLIGGDIVFINFTVTSSKPGTRGIVVDSDNNQIKYCNIVNNRCGGIIFYDSGVENTCISNCYFYNPGDSGIHIYVGDYGLVWNTSISYCEFIEDKVYLSGAPNSIISDCVLYGRNAYILISRMSDDSHISNCTLDSVTPVAIWNECDRLKIINCTLTNCEEGIRIAYGPKKTHISNCSIINSYDNYGILFFGDSKKTIITGCNISNNSIGLGFFSGVYSTRIMNCNFAFNQRGVDFYSFNCFNRFYRNNFINNEKHINTFPPGGNVLYMVDYFNENYWSDWRGHGPYHVCRLLNWDWNPVSKPYDIGV